MTIALWCILAGAVLPYLGTLFAKAGGRMPISANANPREWVAKLQGWQKRGHWAELNSFEAFPAFAAAVLVAHHVHAAQGQIDKLAVSWVAFRLAYLACYIADASTLRSLMWLGGVVCTVWLFLLGA